MKMRSVVLVGLALALADSMYAAGQQRDRQQKRDASCKTTATVTAQGDQRQKRDRLRDGSCTTTATPTADQLRQRDRLRDGSCKP